jgi:hypothetical protein
MNDINDIESNHDKWHPPDRQDILTHVAIIMVQIYSTRQPKLKGIFVQARCDIAHDFHSFWRSKINNRELPCLY